MDTLTLSRFKAKLIHRGDCYIWTGAKANNDRYGKMKVYGKGWLVHRLAYTHVYGPIPEGYTVDHKVEEGICSSSLCVRPSHLQLLTRQENNWKQHGSTKETHSCGHPRSLENTASSGGCRICYNSNQRFMYRRAVDLGFYDKATGRAYRSKLD